MLKLFGCALVLMSCYMMSSALAGREKMKIERVELLILLVRTIRDKVDCYALPIGKILDECREEILFPLGIKKPISELSRLVCECKDGMTKEAEKTLQNTLK